MVIMSSHLFGVPHDADGTVAAPNSPHPTHTHFCDAVQRTLFFHRRGFEA